MVIYLTPFVLLQNRLNDKRLELYYISESKWFSSVGEILSKPFFFFFIPPFNLLKQKCFWSLNNCLC